MLDNSPTEDVFDDKAEETVLTEKEWSRLRKSRVKDGFRDGIGIGQDHTLQEGFNQGYNNAATVSCDVARLRGMLCAMISYELRQQGEEVESPKLQKMKEILDEVVQLEVEYKDCLKQNREGIKIDRSSPQATTSNSELVDKEKLDSHSTESSGFQLLHESKWQGLKVRLESLTRNATYLLNGLSQDQS